MGMSLLALLAQAAQDKPKEAEKPPETRTLKVKLNYTGAGPVDAKHKIFLFVFDTPDFAQGGGVMPIAFSNASDKKATMTIADLTKSPVYIVATYDPKGEYDGMSGPPPSGSSMAMYSTNPPTPAPIKIEAGKTAEVDLPMDDSFKMP